MPPQTYKVWSVGAHSSSGGTEYFDVGLCAKAKRSQCKFELANELIGLRLGNALGLNIPAAGVLELHELPFFASLEPAICGEKLPPLTPDNITTIIETRPNIACGIVLFDSWIVNEDRHEGNIAFFEATQEIFLIDHGRALLNGDGRSHLDRHRDGICIGFDNHVLAADLKTLADFEYWDSRIRELPEFYIRDTLLEAAQYGLPYDDIDFCFEFLISRREKLKSLFRAHRTAAFPSLDDRMIDPLADAPEPIVDYCQLGI